MSIIAILLVIFIGALAFCGVVVVALLAALTSVSLIKDIRKEFRRD